MINETIISATYIQALSIGLLYGTIFCTSECLPILVSYIAGIGAGFRKGTIITLIYSAGRLISYTLIGVGAALIGGSLAFFVDEAILLNFRVYSPTTPDLVIDESSIAFTPIDPRIEPMNETNVTNIGITVRNIGRGDASNILVRVYDRNVSLFNSTITTIAGSGNSER